jgi:predicted transcriptional regulator YheO
MERYVSIKVLKTFLYGIVPALIAACLIYLIFSIPKNKTEISALPGSPLASYPQLYPILPHQNGNLILDASIFMNAARYLLENENPKAAADLLYLGQSNNINLLLSNDEKRTYARLHQHYDYSEFELINEYRNNLFHVYRDIVNGIGQTFSGTGIEIVLHDVRNPLKSIVAIQNPISGRRLDDPNTNFGLELIKDYSIIPHPGVSYVSYELSLNDGRRIKSTTIPLYSKRYGLIGFICLNIDISKLSTEHPNHLDSFLSHFTAISDNHKIHELIEISKVHH